MGKKILDRRIQRTRKLLQDALLELILEKGYDAITVQEIIDRANMGRSTFYAHFEDKENLLLSEFEDMRKQFNQHLMNHSVAEVSPWQITLLMFQHAQSQHRLYKALIGKQGGNTMISHINTYLSTLLQEHLELHSSKKKKEVIPPEILAYYVVSSFMALLTWWLDHDMPYSPEQMNSTFEQLMRFGVESVIRQT